MCVIAERFWPIRMLWSCPSCKAVGSMKKEPVVHEKRILITCEGNINVVICIHFVYKIFINFTVATCAYKFK